MLILSANPSSFGSVLTTLISAVAPEVPPVTVSPATKSPDIVAISRVLSTAL